jgi:hypothetical protein
MRGRYSRRRDRPLPRRRQSLSRMVSVSLLTCPGAYMALNSADGDDASFESAAKPMAYTSPAIEVGRAAARLNYARKQMGSLRFRLGGMIQSCSFGA